MNDFDDLIQEFKKIKMSIVEFEQLVAEQISDIKSKIHEFSDSLEEKFCQSQYGDFDADDDFGADDDFDEDLEQEKYVLNFVNGREVKNLMWNRKLPVDTTRTKYFGDFVSLLLTFNPIVIRIPVSAAPIVPFHDRFVLKSDMPLKGNYIYGSVCDVPIIVDNKLKDTILMENGNEEVIIVTIKE